MAAVSIIMPVYNKEKYIERAIQSIVNQTFKDWELIIVDDGSKDNSLSVCKKYLCDKIKVISIENNGVSNARNIGLNMSCGDFVTFIDADDYVSNDYIETLYQPQCDFIISGLTKISKNGDFLDTIKPLNNGIVRIDALCESFYKEQINSGIYGFVAGKCVKKSVITNNKIQFDRNIDLAEDYDFFLKIYNKLDSILFLDYSGYFYLIGTDNSAIGMSDKKIDFIKQIEIQNKTRTFLENHNSFGENEKNLYMKRVAGYIYTILINCNCNSYKSYLSDYKRLKNTIQRVNPKEVNSILIKVILCLYNKNKYSLIFILLKIRRKLGR